MAQKKVFDQLDETLFHETLTNGLDVYVLPKKGFNKTFATFTTKYGSIDDHFTPLGQKESLQVPDGIAHFLEHKLFEKEHGDVFHDFSKQGASANAFTSFTRTAYLFSTTTNVEKNLETLLDFVQEPYFTEATVNKEKGIIAQEINMYNDNADWRLFFGLIEAMYHKHPVQVDIAGTVKSIDRITADLLYTCYKTFYHPSNMLLFVTGNVQPEEVFKQVRDNQEKKPFTDQAPVERFFEEEDKSVSEAKKVIHMTVQTPKCLIGFKDPSPTRQGKEMLQHEVAVNVALDYLLGKSSSAYERLLDEEIIDESFSFDYTQEDGFGFLSAGGDTTKPDLLAEEISALLLDAISSESQWDAQHVEEIKKKKIGGFLRSLNSPEYIANQFTRYQFNEMNLFDVVPVLEQLSLRDIQAALKAVVTKDGQAVCQILPKS
ncbi:EF-P 5-aminopentanol modification-associated protein YfmH [Aureibacillus halotolerans]|uniref:Putative Zn-dependent peptidase n=1 Tax=Aureibacillus halotolerans TaxID=1508390 RepID=A0A4R6U249_9BACI|nr:pitrilysin family protein [Aureibacillus halotolerans]TDQ39706.1 putative Zn-dependent peptidase [Aureibacillus halotolerans]